MSGNSKIEWTDATWNPVRGCSRVSPGCGGANHEGGCYAEKIAARFSGPGQPFEGFARRAPNGGQWTGKLGLVESALDLPLRWKKPRRIFVNSMSDLFHENLPDEAIDRVFAVMALCPQHTFQVLTKRAGRMRAYLTGIPEESNDDPRQPHQRILAAAENPAFHGPMARYTHLRDLCEMDEPCLPLPNIWLGVSVEDQERKSRIGELRQTPAAKRFLSLEPLLENLGGLGLTGIDWVITGGESGPRARSANRAWYRSIRDQCQAAGVAYFHKQNGEWIDADEWLDFLERRDGEPQPISMNGNPWQPPRPLNYTDASRLAELAGDPVVEHHSDGSTLIRVGKHAAGRLLDGKEHSEFPA